MTVPRRRLLKGIHGMRSHLPVTGDRLRRATQRIAITIGVAVLTTLMLSTPPAQAHDLDGNTIIIGNYTCAGDDPYPYAGIVASCFGPDDDDFWVRDDEKDGKSAAVWWRTSYGRTGQCINSHGYGSWHRCDFNMDDGVGALVYWWHYTYNGSTGEWSSALSGPYVEDITE